MHVIEKQCSSRNGGGCNVYFASTSSTKEEHPCNTETDGSTLLTSKKPIQTNQPPGQLFSSTKMPFWTIRQHLHHHLHQRPPSNATPSQKATTPSRPSTSSFPSTPSLGSSHFYRSGKQLPSDRPFVRLVVHDLAGQTKDFADGLEAGYERGRLLIDLAIQGLIVDKGCSYVTTPFRRRRIRVCRRLMGLCRRLSVVRR